MFQDHMQIIKILKCNNMATYSDQLNNMTKVLNFNLSSLNDLFARVSKYTYIQ